MSQVSERVAIIERETSSLEANMDRNAAEETNKLRREVEEKIVEWILGLDLFWGDQKSIYFSRLLEFAYLWSNSNHQN